MKAVEDCDQDPRKIDIPLNVKLALKAIHSLLIIGNNSKMNDKYTTTSTTFYATLIVIPYFSIGNQFMGLLMSRLT